eukprot:6478404-Amphidinium_carterae.1
MAMEKCLSRLRILKALLDGSSMPILAYVRKAFIQGVSLKSSVQNRNPGNMTYTSIVTGRQC